MASYNLKSCTDQLCVPLAILFIKSLESGMLPSDWNIAIGHIVPIFKKMQSQVKVNNYIILCVLTSAIVKDAFLLQYNCYYLTNNMG